MPDEASAFDDLAAFHSYLLNHDLSARTAELYVNAVRPVARLIAGGAEVQGAHDVHFASLKPYAKTMFLAAWRHYCAFMQLPHGKIDQVPMPSAVARNLVLLAFPPITLDVLCALYGQNLECTPGGVVLVTPRGRVRALGVYLNTLLEVVRWCHPSGYIDPNLPLFPEEPGGSTCATPRIVRQLAKGAPGVAATPPVSIAVMEQHAMGQTPQPVAAPQPAPSSAWDDQ